MPWDEITKYHIALGGEQQGRDSMKGQAIEEIRRRMEAATDKETEMRWRVIEKLVETDLTLDQVGKISDETGEVFVYAIHLPGVADEICGGAVPGVFIEPLRGSVELFDRYAESANQATVLSEDQKKVCLQRLYEAMGIGL